MPVLTQLNLNVGTEQNPNMVLHDINDKRISTTAVTTATHLLTCNSSVTSIAPITAANLASVLGVEQYMFVDSEHEIPTSNPTHGASYIILRYRSKSSPATYMYEIGFGMTWITTLDPVIVTRRMDGGTWSQWKVISLEQ